MIHWKRSDHTILIAAWSCNTVCVWGAKRWIISYVEYPDKHIYHLNALKYLIKTHEYEQLTCETTWNNDRSLLSGNVILKDQPLCLQDYSSFDTNLQTSMQGLLLLDVSYVMIPLWHFKPVFFGHLGDAETSRLNRIDMISLAGKLQMRTCEQINNTCRITFILRVMFRSALLMLIQCIHPLR